MAKASSSQRSGPSKSQSRSKPYDPSKSTGSSTATGSISKLKASLRSATRLLQKSGLDAALRVETERRVESLRAELEEAEKTRHAPPAPTKAIPAAVPADDTQKQGHNDGVAVKKDKGKQREQRTPKNEKKQGVYKMLRHVEYQKTRRRVKSAKKELKEVQEQLDALNEKAGDRKLGKEDRKAKKALEQDLAQKEEALLLARTDAWYVSTFPETKKYVSLFPAGAYTEFPEELPAVDAISAGDEGSLSLFPSVKNPDEVRTFWRAVVKGRLQAGQLEGEPVKDKKKQKDKKAKGSEAQVDEEQVSEPDVDDSEEEEGDSGEVDLDEEDDFFE